MANPLWGAPRVHGELLMLGIEVAQSTVAKYMVPRSRQPPSQGWKTFLRNHAAGIASIDLFVVPTAFFKLLYGLVILGHERRRLIGFGVTDQKRHSFGAFGPGAKVKVLILQGFSGGQGQNRTVDTWIFSPLLYRLSYLPVMLGMRHKSDDHRYPSARLRATPPWLYRGREDRMSPTRIPSLAGPSARLRSRLGLPGDYA